MKIYTQRGQQRKKIKFVEQQSNSISFLCPFLSTHRLLIWHQGRFPRLHTETKLKFNCDSYAIEIEYRFNFYFSNQLERDGKCPKGKKSQFTRSPVSLRSCDDCQENLFKFFIIYILTSLRRALFRKYNITNWIIHMRAIYVSRFPTRTHKTQQKC